MTSWFITVAMHKKDLSTVTEQRFLTLNLCLRVLWLAPYVNAHSQRPSLKYRTFYTKQTAKNGTRDSSASGICIRANPPAYRMHSAKSSKSYLRSIWRKCNPLCPPRLIAAVEQRHPSSHDMTPCAASDFSYTRTRCRRWNIGSPFSYYVGWRGDHASPFLGATLCRTEDTDTGRDLGAQLPRAAWDYEESWAPCRRLNSGTSCLQSNIALQEAGDAALPAVPETKRWRYYNVLQRNATCISALTTGNIST